MKWEDIINAIAASKPMQGLSSAGNQLGTNMANLVNDPLGYTKGAGKNYMNNINSLYGSIANVGAGRDNTADISNIVNKVLSVNPMSVGALKPPGPVFDELVRGDVIELYPSATGSNIGTVVDRGPMGQLMVDINNTGKPVEVRPADIWRYLFNGRVD